MAQYEQGSTATREQLDAIETNVSPDVKALLETYADNVALYGSDDAKQPVDVDGDIPEKAVAISNANLDVDMDNSEVFVASNISGEIDASDSVHGVTGQVNDSRNLELDLANDKDNSLTLGGDNGNTNVSVETGDGNDDISIQNTFSGSITTGSGDLELSLDETAQENAEISVDAGEGFDVMKIEGRIADHDFSSKDGAFHMSSADITLRGIEVVAADENGDGKITEDADHIAVLATTREDSLIAKLYKVALGREAIDGEDGWGDSTLGGLNWWMNEYEKTNDINNTEQLVRAFLNCDEFHQKYDSMDDTAYVNALFSNLGISDVKAAQSYIDQLSAGTLDRAEVAWQIADSDQAVQLLGNDGLKYVIDGFTDEA